MKLGKISSDLQKNLLELSQQCLTFKDRVNHFVGSHKRNRKTLHHHMQLVELLEVPQLVDACSRNGFYDEACELANFVNGLERRHLLAAEVKSLNGKIRGGSGVIQTIVDDVHKTLAGLRQQLLQHLTDNIALPKEISILATLRKLDGLLIDRHLSLERRDAEAAQSSDSVSANSSNSEYRDKLRQQYAQNSEIRLQMDFLEARTVWLHRNSERSTNVVLKTATANSDNSSQEVVSSSSSLLPMGSYGKAIELLELRRTAWFAVITQFNALFRDNDDTNTTVVAVTNLDSNNINGNNINGNNHRNVAVEQPTGFSTAAMILNAWTTRQVSLLLRELEQLLPMIDDGSSLRSVLEQTLFFASRMSQVGCDFSGLVVPLFEEVLLNRFERELHRAVHHFKTMLLTERISTSDLDYYYHHHHQNKNNSSAVTSVQQPQLQQKDQVIVLYNCTIFLI